ncbi:MAG: SRPBCC family protein [Telluria sp.]
MENRFDQQHSPQQRHQFTYDPDRPLPHEEHGIPHAYADVVWQGGREHAEREATLGTVLGWVSIALGASQVLAPRAFARATGLPRFDWLYRAIGLRELACGVGLLAQPKSPVWKWARVAGDTMDVAVLGAAMFSPRSERNRLAATAAIAAGITALDVRAGAWPRRSPSSETLPGTHGQRRVLKAITVNAAPEECYRFWHNFESFPQFMRHIESVEKLDDKRSHWCATGPAGSRVEWDAEITSDEPNRLLAWRSTGNSDVYNTGTVQFAPAPGGKGTLLQVEMEYSPPGGTAGAMVAMLFGEEPSQQMEGDLRRFKQLIECGEIPTTQGQPHGQRSLKSGLFNRKFEQ